MNCIYCEIKCGIYNCRCPDCRTRLVLREPCKVIRKQLVDSMRKRYGDTEGWKGEPHCGCETNCKRKVNMLSAQEDIGYND